MKSMLPGGPSTPRTQLTGKDPVEMNTSEAEHLSAVLSRTIVWAERFLVTAWFRLPLCKKNLGSVRFILKRTFHQKFNINICCVILNIKTKISQLSII